MGFQIYGKVLIRIRVSQPLLEGFSALARSCVLMLMEGYEERCKKTTKNLIKRKYLPVKCSPKIASKHRTFAHTSHVWGFFSSLLDAESGSGESHKHYYYGRKMCRALDTAWRIIKNFLWILHYSNKGSDVCWNKPTANGIPSARVCRKWKLFESKEFSFAKFAFSRNT